MLKNIDRRFNPDNARDNIFRKPVKVDQKALAQHTTFLSKKYAKFLAKPVQIEVR